MEKLSTRWVPRVLTLENKRNHVTNLMADFALFRHNPSGFLRPYTTVDETVVHFYTSEPKEQSKKWTALGELALKKAKTVKSAGKVMETVFLDVN